jgi:hypothetical protein
MMKETAERRLCLVCDRASIALPAAIVDGRDKSLKPT